MSDLETPEADMMRDHSSVDAARATLRPEESRPGLDPDNPGAAPDTTLDHIAWRCRACWQSLALPAGSTPRHHAARGPGLSATLPSFRPIGAVRHARPAPDQCGGARCLSQCIMQGVPFAAPEGRGIAAATSPRSFRHPLRNLRAILRLCTCL